MRMRGLGGGVCGSCGRLEKQGCELRQLKQTRGMMNSAMGLQTSDQERRSVHLSKNNASQAAPSLSVRPSKASQPEITEGFTFSTKVKPGVKDVREQDNAAAMYENAFSLIKATNYKSAAAEFAKFLTQYPDHVLAGNAQYWLGETHYVRKEFDVAARVFAEGFQKYPNGSKVADNLLKLGMSLANLGKVKDACVALQQLAKNDYKDAGPVVRRAEQERARLKCNQ